MTQKQGRHEGERLRNQFWHNLVHDAGPLAPLSRSDLKALIQLLAKLDEPDQALAENQATQHPDHA